VVDSTLLVAVVDRLMVEVEVLLAPVVLVEVVPVDNLERREYQTLVVEVVEATLDIQLR
tara:strand:+ start:1175 stop:1351 length:177 start_codon:yes stop_codon:yes gene_type:complete